MIAMASLKTAIDDWDPIRLLSSGAPGDEYMPEIDAIAKAVHKRDCTNVSEVAQVIYDVFSSAFGEDVFLSDLTECLAIAQIVCCTGDGSVC